MKNNFLTTSESKNCNNVSPHSLSNSRSSDQDLIDRTDNTANVIFRNPKNSAKLSHNRPRIYKVGKRIQDFFSSSISSLQEKYNAGSLFINKLISNIRKWIKDPIPLCFYSKESIKDKLRNDPEKYSKLRKNLQIDKEIGLVIVNANIDNYSKLDGSLQENLAIGLAVVHENPEKYSELHPSLRANEEIGLVIVNANIDNYSKLDGSLQENLAIGLAVVHKNAEKYSELHSSLRANEKIGLVVVNANIDNYSKLDGSLQENLAIGLAVVRRNPEKYSELSTSLRANEKIGLAIVNANIEDYSKLDASLQENLAIGLAVVWRNPEKYSELSISLRANEEIGLVIVDADIGNYSKLDASLRINNTKFVEKAILELSSNRMSSWFSTGLEEKIDPIDLLYEKNDEIWEKNPFSLRNRKYMALACVESGIVLYSDLSPNLKKCPDITEAAFKKEGGVYTNLSERLKAEESIMLLALEKNASVYEELPEDLKKEPEFLLKGIAKNSELYRFLPESIRTEEFNLGALSKNGGIYLDLPKSCQTEEFLKDAMCKNCNAYMNLPRDLQMNNNIIEFVGRQFYWLYSRFPIDLQQEKLITKAYIDANWETGVKDTGSIIYMYENIPELLRNDADIVLALVSDSDWRQSRWQFDGENINFYDLFIHESLKKDVSFLSKVVQQNGYFRDVLSEEMKALVDQKLHSEKVDILKT